MCFFVCEMKIIIQQKLKKKKDNKHRSEITLILSSEFLCGESETVIL